MDFNRNLVDCAVIKVDINKSSEKEGTINYGNSYSVRIKDIEETVKFIQACFSELGIPYSRIYLSGFTLLTEGSIWTKQRIVESIKFEASRINSCEQDSNVLKK